MKADSAICIAFAVTGGLLFFDTNLPDWIRYLNLGSCWLNTFAGLWNIQEKERRVR